MKYKKVLFGKQCVITTIKTNKPFAPSKPGNRMGDSLNFVSFKVVQIAFILVFDLLIKLK
jgi:hypothetical protein